MTNGPTVDGIRLFAITNIAHFPDCIQQCEELCNSVQAGSLAVVLREPEASGRQLLKWAGALREVTSRAEQRLFVADRADLARIVAADGVHLPSFGLTPSSVDSTIVPLVGRSGHSLERLTDEDWRRISYVWVSPVAAPRKGRAPLGEAGLRERIAWIRQRSPQVAVYALGGITCGDVSGCFRAGASGVAAIRAVWEPSERGALLRALQISR